MLRARGMLMVAVSCARLVLAFLLGAFAPASLSAEPTKRVALVVGNAAYKHSTPLSNPVNDAEDIAKALSELGFQVTKRVDVDKVAMDGALREFTGDLKGAALGLFFYAGHGLQVNGQNHLVPIDARLDTASTLEFETVRLDTVQRAMESETVTNLLFIDACRDNPLLRNLARSMGTRSNAIGRGLAVQEAGSGTLISFSTQPGNTALDGVGGRNSPYAAALVKHIQSPGSSLPVTLIRVRNDVMQSTAKRQVPWEHSALTTELVLAASGGEVATALNDRDIGGLKNAETNKEASAAAQDDKSKQDQACPTQDALAPFAPTFESLWKAYRADMIGLDEYRTRRRSLVEQALPKIMGGPDEERCILQMNKLVQDMYKKDWILLDDFNKLRQELSKRLFDKQVK